MNMNSTVFNLVIILVIAFVFLLLVPSGNPVPYSDNKLAYSSYEAFAEYNTEGDDEEPETFAEYNTEGDDEEPETFAEYNTEDKKSESFAEGFEPVLEESHTLSYGLLRDSDIIDKFSQVTSNGIDGVDGCVSSGLSNSNGYICLTPELIDLLKTRGGNATGGDCLSK